MSAPQTPVDLALEHLRRPLRLTWAGLLAERAARAFWPVWSLLFAALAIIGFGGAAALPATGFWIVAALWLGAFLWALGRGLRRFHWPRRADAFARLDATLPGRPLTALADRQAIGAMDQASAAVWRAHVLRMAERAAQARAARPDLRLAARDPYALRYVAATALAMALLFGAFARTGDLADIAPAPLRFEAQAATSAWEAWVQPPAYTGRPSLYLNEVDRPSLQVPVGSRVTVRLYGQTGVLTLAESVSGRDGLPDEPGAPAHDFTVDQPGRIAVQGPGGRSWEVTVVADQPPSVRIREAMTREQGGTLRQPFEAQDDYGVVAGVARISLDLDRVDRRHGLAPEPDTREAIELDLPMPVAGDRSRFTEALIDDLSEHPWANLPVTVRLTVEDALGQTGHSETREVTLPGRRFFDPAAAAVVEQRRDLLWSRDSAPRVSQILRAVSHGAAEETFRSDRALGKLRDAIGRLDAALDEGTLPDSVRDEIAEALWEIATLIEDGDLASAAERLQRAQERLAEAMRRGADQSEIDELMAELRDAMRDYLQELARQAPQDGDDGPEGERMEITGDQLQEMLDRIQELMEEGRMAEAMELLQQLQQMLENMQVTQGEGGEGGPGQEALDGIGEALRQQQGLSDDTFQDLQDRFGQERGQEQGPQAGDQPGPGEEGETPGEGGEGQMGEGRGEGQGLGDGDAPGQGLGQNLADRQRALRDTLRDLDALDLPGDGTQGGEATREALDDAARAMEEAERALRDGDGAGALDRQSDAIDALREGMSNLAEEMARENGGGGERDMASLGQDGLGGQRDPLGRESGNTGRLGTDADMLPGEDAERRARELLDEIRRRSGEQDRPEDERDYLRRLLERF